MALFETIVLSNVMKVVTANYYGPLHFHLDYNTTKNSTSDLNGTSKRAFLVDIFAFLGFSGRLKTKTNFLNIPQWPA